MTGSDAPQQAFNRGQSGELILKEEQTCLCGASRWETAFHYTEPPEVEPRYAFTLGKTYERTLLRCRACGHFRGIHNMDMRGLYAGNYNNTTYADLSGLRRSFERINNLDPAQSDNVGRVGAILSFAKEHHLGAPPATMPPTILDVGSGLCVFLYRMKQAGWTCTALDPDAQAVQHARDTVAIKAIHGSFMEVRDLDRFDAITFNKVLEHVEDPVAMLAHAKGFLAPNGFVYVEVPDGEEAIKEGPFRQEFCIDHGHVFSMSSLSHLSSKAGFKTVGQARLRDPSSKYTLRAFLVLNGANA